MQTQDIVVKRLPHPGPKGYRYEAYLGADLLVTSRDPHHSACRKLLALGLTGTARFFRPGSTQHDMQMHIERGALRTVSENAQHGPRIVKYNAYWGTNAGN